MNMYRMKEYFTVSVLTKQAVCLNVPHFLNSKKFLCMVSKDRKLHPLRIEMCHDREQVKSPKTQPWYIVRKFNTLM